MRRKYITRLAKQERAEKHRLKTRYGKLYSDIARILFEHDSIGVNFGSNTYEYEPEVDTILPRLKEANDSNDVRRIVYEEFKYWFGHEEVGLEARYDDIAREIWKVWSSDQKNRL